MKQKDSIINKPYQICTCCVMDTSDVNITFDKNGVCHNCNEYFNRILPSWNHGKGHEEELQKLISAIKKKGKNREYDCILGLSGGLDSAFMLHLAVKEWGEPTFRSLAALRPRSLCRERCASAVPAGACSPAGSAAVAETAEPAPRHAASHGNTTAMSRTRCPCTTSVCWNTWTNCAPWA